MIIRIKISWLLQSDTTLLKEYTETSKHLSIIIMLRLLSGRKVSLSDRQWMPYTEAVIHEILRHSSLVYAVPQATTTDVELDE